MRLDDPAPALLTSVEAGRLLGVSRKTVVRWAESGHLRSVRLGPSGRWRILRHSVMELVQAEPVVSPGGYVYKSPAPPNGQEAA
jgi:excisionase family DNA binding protein